MTFSIQEGAANSEIRKQLRALDIKIERGIRQGFFKVGSLLKKTASEQMLEKKHGRLYRLKKGKKTITGITSYGRITTSQRTFNHVASAPGQSPANFTGKLRRSIGFEVDGYKMVFGAGGRDSGVDYAAYLEDGTDWMLSRPLLKNAVYNTSGATMQIFNECVGKELATLSIGKG